MSSTDSQKPSKNTVQVEDDKKGEHLVSRAQCQDKTKPCVWQSYTYTHTGNTNTHAHRPKHSFMHAHSNLPAPKLANKQKKKKNPPYTQTHTHTHPYTFIVPALMHSRVQLERKKKSRM